MVKCIMKDLENPGLGFRLKVISHFCITESVEILDLTLGALKFLIQSLSLCSESCSKEHQGSANTGCNKADLVLQ